MRVQQPPTMSRNRDHAFLKSLSHTLWNTTLYKAALHTLRGRDVIDKWADDAKCWTWVWNLGDPTEVKKNDSQVDLTVCPEGITQQGEVKGIVQRGVNNSGTRCSIWCIQPSFWQIQRHRKWDHLHDLNSFLVPHWTQSIFWLGKLWKQWEMIFSIFAPRSYKIDCRVIRISEWEINPMGPYTAVIRFKK